MLLQVFQLIVLVSSFLQFDMFLLSLVDDDNDNETMFIAKWHTVHVQRT